MSDWQATLARLADESGRRLVRTAYLICGDADSAEDLVQEAFVRCFSRRRTRTQLAALSSADVPVTGPDAEAYLRRTMVNIAIDLGRRNRRWRARSHLFAPADSPDVAGPVETRLDILSALDRLSPRQRACVVLRYFDDLPVAQVAADLSLAEGTVKRHLFDALRRLRDQLPETLLEGEQA